MLFNLSEVIKLSDFLKNWDGKQKSDIKTSNSKLTFYHETRIDSDINVILIKILQKYDIETFVKILDEGFCIKYQSFHIYISKHSDHIEYLAQQKNGGLCGLAKIKNSGVINIINEFTNKDALDVLFELFKGVELSLYSIANSRIKSDFRTVNILDSETYEDNLNKMIAIDKMKDTNRLDHINSNSNLTQKDLKKTLTEIIDSLEIN